MKITTTISILVPAFAASAGAWISGVLPTVYRLPFGCDSSLAGFVLLA